MDRFYFPSARPQTQPPQLRNSLSSDSLLLLSPSRSPVPKPAARFFSSSSSARLHRLRPRARPQARDLQLLFYPRLPARRLATRVIPFLSRDSTQSSSPEAQPVVSSGSAHVQHPGNPEAHCRGPTQPSNPLSPVQISKAQSGPILPQQPNSPTKTGNSGIGTRFLDSRAEYMFGNCTDLNVDSRRGPHTRDLTPCGLGVFTFPWGRVTDTRERRGRHLSFYDPEVEGG
ncbi:hypothetical protein CRG98_039270 [Punica granatum]|uniref:Uncharacterized protein n=1 Tax=Punica granatum TaxID=22663 RepID=A0A2I0I8N3_PUNGR|nr:hypothetical protein CRG98_039270 [Punica granatum]